MIIIVVQFCVTVTDKIRAVYIIGLLESKPETNLFLLQLAVLMRCELSCDFYN
jgi:hypothetical protein